MVLNPVPRCDFGVVRLISFRIAFMPSGVLAPTPLPPSDEWCSLEGSLDRFSDPQDSHFGFADPSLLL